MAIDPLIASLITGGIALMASGLSLLLGLFNHALARRKLSFEEEQKQEEARRLTDKYRNPLVASAHELASRLYNIINLDFFIWATRGPCERAYTETHTLFLFAQFLGWVELLSTEVQFLDLGPIERTRKLNELLAAVRSTLRASHLGDEHTFRLFAGQQRAIGEGMVVERGGMRTVLGYKAFCRAYWDKTNPSFAFWLQPLAQSISHCIMPYTVPMICNQENKLWLYLELEMRFVRLELLWQNLSDLIVHLDPEQAYHQPDQFTQPPSEWALPAKRRRELEAKMREDPGWPHAGPWRGNRVLEARRVRKGHEWLKKAVQAEWQRCPRTLLPVTKDYRPELPGVHGLPLLLQAEAAGEQVLVEEVEGSEKSVGGASGMSFVAASTAGRAPWGQDAKDAKAAAPWEGEGKDAGGGGGGGGERKGKDKGRRKDRGGGDKDGGGGGADAGKAGGALLGAAGAMAKAASRRRRGGGSEGGEDEDGQDMPDVDSGGDDDDNGGGDDGGDGGGNGATDAAKSLAAEAARGPQNFGDSVLVIEPPPAYVAAHEGQQQQPQHQGQHQQFGHGGALGGHGHLFGAEQV